MITRKQTFKLSERQASDVSLVEILYEEFSITSREINGQLELDDGFEMPSEEDIKIATERYLKKLKLSKYREERYMRYPSVIEQLDMLYHDIVSGNLDNGTWIKSIKDIKNQYPKPE